MKYAASIHLKKADTEGQVPASILDEYVRQALIRQISAALMPNLTVLKTTNSDDCGAANANLVNFTTDVVVLSVTEWNFIKEQFSWWVSLTASGEQHPLQTLIDTAEKT